MSGDWFFQICSRLKKATVRQQYKPLNSRERKEIQVIPIKPPRRIRKCPENDPNLGEIDLSAPKFVFGPLYPRRELYDSGVENAWLTLLEAEGGGNQEDTKEIYMSAIRRVEKKARDAYGDEALENLTKLKFRWMMIKDGCFFLQLALHILGASDRLGYTENHLILGQKKHNKKTLQGWIKSMFLVGNQIPLVVLNELMKQSFFQKVLIDGLDRPSDLLSKQILFDLLVKPALEYKISKKLAFKACSQHQQLPSDVLHGLQLFLLGRGDSIIDTSNEQEDELEHGDLESGIKLRITPQPIIDNKDGDDRKKLCVSELSNKGIFIWRSDTAGSRGIDFKTRMFFGSLTLPTLKVNHDINVLFSNLKYYEIAHQEKETRSYMRFLSELVSTYEDLNILAKEGIIDASTSEEKERFLETLRTLADKETAHNHQSVIGKVKDYSVFPWEKFKYVAILVFFLTIAQTAFGVLSYLVGRKQLRQSRGL